MKVVLIFHGSLKEYNDNCKETEIAVPQGTTAEQILSHTNVPKEKIAFVAVNGSRALLTQILQEGDEVKLFQMVGGG